jgi:hypothetical protein
MTGHRSFNPSHPQCDRKRALNIELSLQYLSFQIAHAANVVRTQSAKPEADRCIDVAAWSRWLEASRNWFAIEAQMMPDRIAIQ